MFGQLTTTPSGARSVMSTFVQPSSSISADCPASTPPRGVTCASRMPLLRATGVSSLSGWNASSARTFGEIGAASAKSRVARLASISVRPRFVHGSIRPG
jgi:hypothetical protein